MRDRGRVEAGGGCGAHVVYVELEFDRLGLGRGGRVEVELELDVGHSRGGRHVEVQRGWRRGGAVARDRGERLRFVHAHVGGEVLLETQNFNQLEGLEGEPKHANAGLTVGADSKCLGQGFHGAGV